MLFNNIDLSKFHQATFHIWFTDYYFSCTEFTYEVHAPLRL